MCRVFTERYIHELKLSRSGHKDGNKLNNRPNNLQICKAEEHEEIQKVVNTVDGQRYRRYCRTIKISAKTKKAYKVGYQWIPKSQSVIEGNYLYVKEWLFKKLRTV